MLDELYHNPLPSLTTDYSVDPSAPIPAFIDTGSTLVDQSNVDQFIHNQ
jgi:ribose transport system substrate-binding protein